MKIGLCFVIEILPVLLIKTLLNYKLSFCVCLILTIGYSGNRPQLYVHSLALIGWIKSKILFVKSEIISKTCKYSNANVASYFATGILKIIISYLMTGVSSRVRFYSRVIHYLNHSFSDVISYTVILNHILLDPFLIIGFRVNLSFVLGQ